MATVPALKDVSLKVTRALKSGAGAVFSDAIDLGHTTNGGLHAPVEFKLSAPALTTGQCTNGSTVTYHVLAKSSSTLSSGATTVQSSILTQTGAGGAGAAANTANFRLPAGVARYLGIAVVNSATDDASAASATLEPLF